MGSHSACLTSAAVNVLVLHILVTKNIQTPFDCFFQLFEFLEKLGPLEEYVLGVSEKCYIEDYKAFPTTSLNNSDFSLLGEKEKAY